MQHVVQVAWIYTLFMATLMGLLVGVTQRILGSPGDLPEVVHQIHTSGRIAISQAPSMFVCSAFSIAAGGICPLVQSCLPQDLVDKDSEKAIHAQNALLMHSRPVCTCRSYCK